MQPVYGSTTREITWHPDEFVKPRHPENEGK